MGAVRRGKPAERRVLLLQAVAGVLTGTTVPALPLPLVSRSSLVAAPDPLIVAEVGRIIARLKSEGQSIVLVEQNIKLALDLADDVVILNPGRVAFTGGVAKMGGNGELITQHLGVF